MKIYEDLINLLEEFINELDDETVENVGRKRWEAENKSWDDLNKKASSPEEAEAILKAAKTAREKVERFERLKRSRKFRKDEERRDLEKFKEKLLNRQPQTIQDYKQAKTAHDNAMIDQGLRNKLEKTFSHECFEEILSLVEGYLRG